MYRKTTAVSKREKELARKRTYNAVYFADPEHSERRRQLALKPEQKIKRMLYKKTARGKAAEKRYQERHKDLVRAKSERHRLKRYGLTPQTFAEMIAAQNDQCAICGLVCNGRFHVDHDHATGKVRGLLCIACNMALGLFKDDKEKLSAAIKYLEHAVHTDDRAH